MGKVAAMVFLVPIVATILLVRCSAEVEQPGFYIYPQPVAKYNHPHPVAAYSDPRSGAAYSDPRLGAAYSDPRSGAPYSHPHPVAAYSDPHQVAAYSHPHPVAAYSDPRSVVDYNHPHPVADYYNHRRPLQSYRRPWYNPYAPQYDFPVFPEPIQQRIDPASPEGRKGGFVTSTVYLTPADKGYTYVKTMGWYKVYPEQVAFDVAKARCEADNARMIIINSQSEADEMVRLMGLQSVSKGWVGLTDAATEETFLTIFGDPIETTHEDWAPDEPDNSENWDCVYMSTGAAGMVVYGCVANPSAAVCEI